MPAGPFASQPLASYIASSELTHRELHSGVTRFQNWFKFQKVFQKASPPSATWSGLVKRRTCSSGPTHSPLRSLHRLRQRAWYMLV